MSNKYTIDQLWRYVRAQLFEGFKFTTEVCRTAYSISPIDEDYYKSIKLDLDSLADKTAQRVAVNRALRGINGDINNLL